MNYKKIVTLIVLICFVINSVLAKYAFACDYTVQGGTVAGADSDFSIKDTRPTDDFSPNAWDIVWPGPVGDVSNGDPISLFDGKFYYDKTLLEIPGDVPIDIKAHYSSFSKFNGSLGYGWSLNYDMRIFPNSEGNLVLCCGDATKNEFISQGNSSYLMNNHQGYEVITINQDGTYTLYRKSGWKYEFDINGVLSAIKDNNGNALLFSYGTAGKYAITGVSHYSNITTPIVIGYDYRLVKIEEERGGTLTGRYVNFDYNADGRIIRILDFKNREVILTYDPSYNGDLIEIEDLENNIFDYVYVDHKMTSFLSGGSLYSRYTNFYDEQGRVWQQIHGNNVLNIDYTDYMTKTAVTTYIYDDQNVLLNTKNEIYNFNADGFSTSHIIIMGNGLDAQTGENDDIVKSFDYDENNRIITENLPRGQTDYQYDAKGNIEKITKHINSTDTIVTDYIYNANNDITSKVISSSLNSDTFTTNYTYYNDHNIHTVEQVVDQSTTNTTIFTYTPEGEIDTVIDPRNNVTKREYNDYGDLTKIYDSNNPIRKIDFGYDDDLGNRTFVTDAKNYTTQFEYDNLNRVTRVINPKNEETIYTWTGPVITQIEAGKYGTSEGLITQMEYDSLNRFRVLKKKNDLGIFITFLTNTYDSGGNVIASTDANNNITTALYDALGRVTQVTDALSHSTQYEYDLNGNPLTVTDAENNITEYQYDDLNRLKQITEYDDSVPIVTSCTYDALSNVLGATDAKTHTTSNVYDGAGRLLQTASPMSHTVGYEYDANNNLIKKTDAKSQVIEYEYDNYNQLTHVYYGGKLSPVKTVVFSYDNNGNMLSWNDGTYNGVYAYDELNRVLSVATAYPFGTKTITYTYDHFGNRHTMGYPDALGTVDYTYDAFNRLTQIDYPLTANRYTLYSYNDASRLIKKTLPNGQYTDYDYDDVNRLTSLTNKQSDTTIISQYSYTHDDIGNRLQKTETRGQTTDVFDYDYDDIYRLTDVEKGFIPTETYTYDKLGNRQTTIDYTNWVHDNENKLNSYDSTTYTYDNNGSMTVKNNSNSLTNYTWDYDNQLTRVDFPNNDWAEYEYDAFGRRIEKKVYDYANTLLSTTYFLYDGDDVIVEYDSAGTVKASYLHGQDIDEPILMTRGGNTYYYTMDGLGSVSELTDSTQAVVESYKYDSFGNTEIYDSSLVLHPSSVVGNPYGFTSREYDSESGLYFYRARYYDPEMGRFLQTDPIGYYGGINLYSYVLNNPINYIDPYGLYTWPYTWKGWTGVILTGSGTVIVFSGIGAPAGWTLIAAGTAFNIWDLVEGFESASKDAEKIGQQWLDKDREEWNEIDEYFDQEKAKEKDKKCPK